jgi:hypothetical protein
VLVQIDPGVQHIDILDEVPDEKQSRKDLVGNIKPLQPSGAIVRVAIAVRVLEVQPQSALSRALKKAACG